MTGEMMLGVQFWQIATERPMYLRVFSPEGGTVALRDKGTLKPTGPCQPYRRTIRQDALGEVITEEPGYGRIPLLPLRANADGLSEFTPAIRSKIEAYDSILSDFTDNLDRANDVYWVLNNFGGTMDEVAEMLEQINRVKAVANLSDGGSGATAEPHTIEVPYAARQTALDLLERSLYQDYMALDMDSLTGSSLTNVAIRVSTANLNLKADRYEWQVRQFIADLLDLIGCPCNDITFKRQTIANESETVADIAVMRGDIDQETALRLNPYISAESIPAVLDAAAEDAAENTADSGADAV